MQKYARALEILLEDKDCDIKIFRNVKGTYTVRADDGSRKALGFHKQWRRAIVLCLAKFNEYKGK